MSSKNPTIAEQKARELAVALKEEICGKLKSGKHLYRSYNNQKFFLLSNEVLNVLERKRDVYDIREFLKQLIDDAIHISTYSLSSGCWGVTKSPVGCTPIECTRDDLEAYFKALAKETCDIVKEVVTDKYKESARDLGLMRKSVLDYE